MMQAQHATLILYACPTGTLAAQLDIYFARSRALCGPNAAHAYPPHITLTGFFHDDAAAIPTYVAALEAALDRARPTQPAPPLRITKMALEAEWHGLVVVSPWLAALTADFAANAHSPTRRAALRLKDWLHLSLAYQFAPENGPALAQLAAAHVDPHAPGGWELRLYERLPDGNWTCHAAWTIDN